MEKWQEDLINNPPPSSSIYSEKEWSDIVQHELFEPSSNFSESNGFFGKHHTEETRMRISESVKSNHSRYTKEELKERHGSTGSKNGMFISKRYGELNPMFGKKHNKQTKELMASKKRGKKATDETKSKLCESHKKYWDSNPDVKRLRSEEYKKRGIKPPSSKGMLWWNDGNTVKRSKECPGDGWVRGRRLDVHQDI